MTQDASTFMLKNYINRLITLRSPLLIGCNTSPRCKLLFSLKLIFFCKLKKFQSQTPVLPLLLTPPPHLKDSQEPSQNYSLLP